MLLIFVYQQKNKMKHVELEMMKEHNIDKSYVEKESGTTKNQPIIKEMLSFVGKEYYISNRSLDLQGIPLTSFSLFVQELTSKGVTLISLKERLDTSTPQGKLMFTMFGALYEFERGA